MLLLPPAVRHDQTQGWTLTTRALVGNGECLEGLTLHCRGVPVVVKRHFAAAKLAGDDPPATAENLKLLPAARGRPLLMPTSTKQRTGTVWSIRA
jgi:hypothetical protein